METLASEFSRLEGITYLDHAGATLYAETQLQNVTKDLVKNVYCNPHTSKLTADCIDQVRFQILNHFNTNSNEYSIIFTSGSTGALKLVAESFKFKINEDANGIPSKAGCFAYLQDNHTSVLGMREVITSKLAETVCVPREELLTTLNDSGCENQDGHVVDTLNSLERALFVYPAQCNFSGYKYPLKWIDKINNGALNRYTKRQMEKSFSEWAVLLDAAAFVSTNRLDLSVFKPDFVCMSFYKIFGYPTGLGALLVKNSSSHFLDDKKYYGGGTVEIAMSGENFHIKRNVLQDRFEDGTISFLSILSLKHGFNILNTIIPKTLNENVMDKISLYTFNLAKCLYEKLKSTYHFNGKSIACIYSDTSYNDINRQGGIVNFNLLRSNGDYIGYAEVTHMAELFNIHIRSGCFCNPGACQRFLNLSNQDLRKHFKAGHVCGDNNDLIDGVPTGSIRVSFGYMSTMKDVESLINMITKCFVDDNKLKVPGELTEYNNISIGLNYEVLKTENNDFKRKGILQEIHIYPLKSCGAFKIKSQWEIGNKGLKFDREWMIVTENGVALTQKQDTRMCLIIPSIDLENNVLLLSFSGVDSVTISLSKINSQVISENSLCRSKVCGDKIEGYDCGDEVASWLLNVLGIPGLRLIRQSDTEMRLFKNKVNSDIGNTPISLSNKAQYLAVNLSSVKWLASKIESQEFNDNIDNLTGRFRGNLIIETKTEFEEFSWQNIRIGNVVFEMNGPCTRCQMVCIDQESGEKTVEPLRTISKQFEGKIHFGSYFSHKDINSNKTNFLTCGDIVYAK